MAKDLKDTLSVQAEVDTLVKNALHALESLRTMNQEQVDAMVKAMAMAGMDQHICLLYTSDAADEL